MDEIECRIEPELTDSELNSLFAADAKDGAAEG